MTRATTLRAGKGTLRADGRRAMTRAFVLRRLGVDLRDRLGASGLARDLLRLGLVELVLELLDRHVHRGEGIRCRGLAPEVVTSTLEAHLAHLLGGDPRVSLLGEVHLRPIHPAQKTTEAADLLFG